MNDAEKRMLIETYMSGYNAFDIDRMLATLHDEVEFRNVWKGVINAHAKGKEQFRHLAEHAKTLFTSRHITVSRFRLEEEPVLLEIHFRGVLAFDLPDGLQRGETLEMEGRSEFGFQDGLIRQIIDIN